MLNERKEVQSVALGSIALSPEKRKTLEVFLKELKPGAVIEQKKVPALLDCVMQEGVVVLVDQQLGLK